MTPSLRMTYTLPSRRIDKPEHFCVRAISPLTTVLLVDTTSHSRYSDGHSNHIGSADMARTQHQKLNEETIKRLHEEHRKRDEAELAKKPAITVR